MTLRTSQLLALGTLVALFAACRHNLPADTNLPAETHPPAEINPPAGDTGFSAAAPSDALVLNLGPHNTRVQFVGTHAGRDPDPNPRTGWFERFSGQARIDTRSEELESVTLEFETATVTTAITNLTNHLRSSDFFDVREYPRARFETTRITPGDRPGEVTVTGNLTLLETTRQITVPATVEIDDGDLRLHSEFVIRRSDYGMNLLMERVVDEVALSVTIGEPAAASP